MNFKILEMKTIFFVVLLFVFVQSCSSRLEYEFEVETVKFKMVYVKGGLFPMGATLGQQGYGRENEKPVHKVAITDFFIAETEVTQGLWLAVMGNNPSFFQHDSDSYPVENVSFNDVSEFLEKLNNITGMQFRLPAESEWEYAARGGAYSQDKMFAGSDSIKDVAWYIDNSNGYPQPVALKKTNELGLYDMSGNVWEWCDTEENGKYIERGGGWANYELGLRVSFRDSDSADYKNYNGGFRLAMSVIP